MKNSKMKKHLIVAGILAYMACANAASARPTYAAADAWHRDFQKAIGGSSSAFLNPNQHAAQGRRLADLDTQAKKLFGSPMDEPFGVCVNAITFYSQAWMEQLSSARKPTNASLIGQTGMSFEAGVNYSACRLAIDALESQEKAPRRRP